MGYKEDMLLNSIKENDTHLAKFLIENGAGVNAKDIDNNTPLHHAKTIDSSLDDASRFPTHSDLRVLP